MATNNPVVIAGRLDDAELKRSVQSLVSSIEQSTQQVAAAFDTSIQKMENSLKRLTDAQKQVSKETKQASKERVNTFDQEAQAMQKALQPKSAKDSFYAFIGTYREQAAGLAREMKSIESLSFFKQNNEFMAFERQIEATKQKIKDLREQLQLVGSNPNASRFEVKSITDQISTLETKLRQLTTEQMNSVRQIAEADKQQLATKQEAYNRITTLIRELTQEEKSAASFSQQQVTTNEQIAASTARQVVDKGTIADLDRQSSEAQAKMYDALNEQNRQIEIARAKTAENLELERQRQELAARTAQGSGKSKSTQEYNELNVAVAKVLGLETQEVQLADGATASYNQLNNTLRMLHEAYNRLSASQRNSDQGKEIALNMQVIERAMQKIQRQAARPMNLQDVLGIQPKTLDDIAYKMQMLSNYRSSLNFTDKNQAGEIKIVNEELAKLRTRQNELLAKNNEITKSNNLVSRSFDYIKNRIAFVLTVGASTQFVKQLIEIRSQYEMLERSIGILIDSMQNGTKVFAELNSMALKSPFTTMELGAAAKQLVAYDIAAEEVVDTTKRLADMAAAVGVPIERLTYALGQIKAYGYLNARDARMFANAGIPLVKELADRYTELEGRVVSVGDVYDRIKKKAIGFNDVMEVINKVTDEGGRFFNFQEKQADTLKVKMANLTLAYNNMLNEIGKDTQGVLVSVIGSIRDALRNWKDYERAIYSLIIAFGALKTYQLINVAVMGALNRQMALNAVLGKALTKTLLSLKATMTALAGDPWTLAFMAAATAATYLIIRYHQIDEANREFNKSIGKNAEENKKAIDSFFEDFNDKLESINDEPIEEQQKMWERVQDEIKKTTKNADGYIDTLEKVENISERISLSTEILEQSKEIQAEIKRLSDLRVFNVGGGFMNGTLAKDLSEYDDVVAKLVKRWGDLDEAERQLSSSNYVNDWSEYKFNLKNAEDELNNFVNLLDKANIDRILGDSGDTEIMLNNLREYASNIRDAFLSTDEGQKLTQESQALLNSTFDAWIAKQGVANGLIDVQREGIEKNRTAWEMFFMGLRREDKQQLDYLIKTNQTGSDEFKKIWDKASKSLQENATTSYELIQQQIAELRNTPDIVINVVYKEKKQPLDEQQEEFEGRFLTPQDVEKNIKNVRTYFSERAKLVSKYGRYQKKEGEDNVEYEKRLGDEYVANAKKIATLNDQLEKSSNLSKKARQQKEHELKLYTDANKALEEVAEFEGFNLERDKKDKKKEGKSKDVLGEALTKEIQLINEAQKRYSEYRKMGLSATEAQVKVSEEYNKSLANVSNTLAKFGIATKPMKELAYMNSRELKAYFQTLLDGATRLGNAKGIEAAEKAIANLNVEITKLDTKKITDGLNNDLSKLKDEYELQVELDATSGLGDALTDLLGIDTSDFPKTFEEYMSKVNQAFDKYRLEMSQWDSPWDVFTMSKQDVEDWGMRFGLDDETIKKVETAVKSQKDTYKKYVQDMVKNANSLEYELSDTAGKIAIKEKELADTREKRNKATTDIERKYLDLTIQNQEKAIDELKAQALALLPEYDRVFGSIAEHSASVARKLQKDLLRVYDTAKFDAASKQYTLTGADGTTVYLDEERYTKERNKLIKDMQKTQSSFQKIKEAFNPSNKKDVVDYAKGIELIGGELSKLGELVSTIGNITQALGMNEDATESINDVSETLKGLGQTAQGYAKIQSGDIIGGATDMITGTFAAISTWFDNSDKKIQRSIKDSEMAVKRLELAYKDLQYAIEDAFGTATVGAEKAALANKTLQLTELKRQLTLQESRTGKNRDEDAIINLKGQIKDLEREIESGYKSIITNLLGISDVGSAVENMVQSVANALRNGENAIDAWNTSIDDMIVNMITRFVSAQVVGPMFQKVIDDMTKTVAQRGVTTAQELEEIKKQRDAKQTEVDEWSALYNRTGLNAYNQGATKLQEELDALNKQIVELEDQAKQQTEFTKQDLEYMVEHLAELKANGGDWMSYLQELLEQYGLMGGANESQLSNLQQGIQGITETTAGALEAYCNNMLTQIYVQVGIQSRMLLELQNSYQIQAAIHAILLGVVNANGMALRVELTN